MFRIRRIYDDATPSDKNAILQVQEILRTQFSDLSTTHIKKLPDTLRNPLKYRLRSILFIAEGSKGKLNGFALLAHEPLLNFCYLEYISASKYNTGGGIGSALYERLREEALNLNSIGLFFEALADDPKLCHDPLILKQNRARLHFYEKYGARPIINTAYETPVDESTDCVPYLLYDDLDQDIKISSTTAKQVVRTILEHTYRNICPPEYINKIVNSFQDDPIKLREFKYQKHTIEPPHRPVKIGKHILLLINELHDIHHVQEIGYVEAPVRINSILDELEKTNLFHRISARHFPLSYIKNVHDPKFVNYFKKVCLSLKPGESVYPYVFPIRHHARPPRDLAIRAGYYCIDTFTPINHNAYLAAINAVNCTLTGAEQILNGRRIVYALVRPPGHHAEHHAFGGFCYFNSLAIAAHYLSQHGKIAILDVDYHHGNGTQQIFYERSDVLTLSIHGHPRYTYPYFSGFADEKGSGIGKGFNVNMPLPENVDTEKYMNTLRKALTRIKNFRPRFLIIALGLDTAKDDPTGSWSLLAKDYEAIGQMIGELKYPTLVVQEGGYDTQVLGINARHFFEGLWNNMY